MDTKNTNHRSYGTMIALDQIGLNIDENHEVKKHLQYCDICWENYQSLVKFNENQRDKLLTQIDFPNFFRDCENPDSRLKKICTLLMIFLEADLPTQDLSKLFRHINDCYPCFESFAKNWSDYQAIQENFRG